MIFLSIIIFSLMIRGVYDVLRFVFLTFFYRGRWKTETLRNRVATAVPLDSVCAICLAPLYTQFLNLPCEHAFHSECINQWLWKHDTCPLCRTVI